MSIPNQARLRAREKTLGLYTSGVTAVIANALFALAFFADVPVERATAVISLVTNLIGYALDVVLAKKIFGDLSGRGGSDVLLDGLGEKLAWLARSLVSFTFVRFMMTVVIDIIITRFVLRYIIGVMDRAGILTEWKWRDSFLAVGITAVNFQLYVNRIRFDWAYNVLPDASLDIAMMTWFSALVISYITYEEIVLRCGKADQAAAGAPDPKKEETKVD